MTTAERKTRFDALSRIGCIVCRIYFHGWSECNIHHAVGLKYRALGKRADDRATFGLCPTHHQYGNSENPSCHGQPKEFASKYGTQEFLLACVDKLISDDSR